MSEISISDSISEDRLKRPISPFLEVGLEEFFKSNMQNSIEKFNPSCTRRGGWDDPQRFFEDNSAHNEPKQAKFLPIQVQ